MKKVLLLLLAFACVFSMFGCGDERLEAFVTAAEATDPAVVNISSELKSELGTLKSNITTTYNEDGSFVMDYSYDELNTSSAGAADEVIVTKTGKVTCDADGNYSDGGSFKGKNEVTTGISLNLDEDLLDYTISQDGNSLTAKVNAADTAEALGVDLGADATITVNMIDGKITSYTIAYTSELGDVSIVCAYE